MLQRLFSMTLAACLLSACQGPRSPATEDDLRLYVLDCGQLFFTDIEAFGISNAETPVREMFVPCYLIRHPEGDLLWDAGLDPELVGQGDVELQPGATMSYTRSVVDQLADIDVAVEEIDYIGLSHMHFDHVGAGKLFPAATLLLQRAEYVAAFEEYVDNPVYNHASYADLARNPRQLLDGDHDLFADGRVQLISAPGHTAGHQVLLVRLTETGPVVLSGDLYHFAETRELRRVPVFNADADRTLSSMDKVEALIRREQATLWIEHEMALARSLNLAPGYYR